MIEFKNVSFFYPPPEASIAPNAGIGDGENAAVERPDAVRAVFGELSMKLPGGVVSVVGENGIGKSTLLLLAGARLFPAEGTITIDGVDTMRFVDAAADPEVEEERNRLVSFVYQNLEFETEEPVGALMDQIVENGNLNFDTGTLAADLRRELELDGFLDRKTQELSKGQLQRTIIAFSLLYGSKIVMMDEPVFALEEPQKDRALGFLHEYSSGNGIDLYYSVHNLELSRKYADHSVLIGKDRTILIGPVDEVLTREKVEAAYQVPYDTLYRRDSLYREMLNRKLT